MITDRAESLFLTVSGNHEQRKYPEYIQAMSDPFLNAGGMIAVYEGVLLGGADKLFGLADLNLWLRRYRYADFNMRLLLPAAHLCLEHAVRTGIAKDRPGVPSMAGYAAEELLKKDPLNWRAASRNWLCIRHLIGQFPDAADDASKEIAARFLGFKPEVLSLFDELVSGSADCRDAKALIEQAVLLYKEIFTRYFAPPHDDDPLPEIAVFDESEFDADSDLPEHKESDEEIRELAFGKRKSLTDPVTFLSEEELARIPEYMERNFGPSFKTGKELEDAERLVCSGIHEGRKLLFTDGLPADEGAPDTIQSKKAAEYRAANERTLKKNEPVARTGIRSIEQAFRNVLNLMSDPEDLPADHGLLVNSSLWKAGRTEDPRLFLKVVRHERPSVAIELLIDASGSQSSRQGMVALQSFIFSAALSRVNIPHRVMSYCTYGDHTVLRRFRDYEDGQEADRKILDYHAASNNRDGLAFAAAGIDLLRRKEDHKIIIVFSDGLPNDMVSGRVRPGMQKKYVGDTAVKDTCEQVRKLKRQGAEILGIFLGEDAELENERLIYGSSFLRIKKAEDFGGSAGRRLREMLSRI